MSNLELIVLGLLLIVAIGWSIYEFGRSAQQFIAPDNADHDAINAEFGEGTSEALAALKKRFGPGDHWRDAKTAVGGLGMIVILIWIWFG